MTATASGAQPAPQPREPEQDQPSRRGEDASSPAQQESEPGHPSNPRFSVDRAASEQRSVDRERDDRLRRDDDEGLKVGSLDEVLRSAGKVVGDNHDAYWSTHDDALEAPLSDDAFAGPSDLELESDAFAPSRDNLGDDEPVSPGLRVLLTPLYMGLRGVFSFSTAAVIMGTLVTVINDLRDVTYSLEQDPLRTLWWLLFFVVSAAVWRRVAKRGPIQAIRDERGLDADVDARIRGLRDWLFTSVRLAAVSLVSLLYLFVPSILVEVLGDAANTFFYDRLFSLTMVLAFFIAWKRSGRWAWVRQWWERS